MIPYRLTLGEYQDEDQTKEWIDSLITQENLPTILTHYDFWTTDILGRIRIWLVGLLLWAYKAVHSAFSGLNSPYRF